MNKKQMMEFFSQYANEAPWAECKGVLEVFDERDAAEDALYILSTQIFDDNGAPLKDREIPEDRPAFAWAKRKIGISHAGAACSPFSGGKENVLKHLDRKYATAI